MDGNTGPTLDSHRLITFAARHNKYVLGGPLQSPTRA